MKQMLKDFSNLLLVVLCDYVLGEAEYLFLGQPDHVALSNKTVSVDFQYSDGNNATMRNVSILLLDASKNQTIATKYLLTNQFQGTLEFECFYFREAGDYWFILSPAKMDNSTRDPGQERHAFLKVEWPVFHIDFNQTSKATGDTLQVGLFINQPLCSFTTDRPDILVELIFTNSISELKESRDQPLEIRISKRISLAPVQWIEFDCAPIGPQAYATVLLKLQDTSSVITSTGPIDLVQRFGYKLVTLPELKCESLVDVMIVPPPCTFAQGMVTVYKDITRHSGERLGWLAENIVPLGASKTAFNCTLFAMGKNKYCFEFSFSSRSHFSSGEDCMMIQRNIETWSLWQAWNPCSVTCGDGVRDRRRTCLTSSPSKPGCVGTSTETSLCSLEECSTFKPSSPSPAQPKGPLKANNIVTVTGISLCLFIIIATVLITLWRKFGRAPKCSTPARHNSIHSPNFRKNSDEENICQLSEQRGSFSDGGEGPLGNPAEISIPLTYRRSMQLTPEEEVSGSESFQSSAQKIIPPLFSYRLAQKQLKEMKRKGLTETTKVYHVSQSPLTDTVVDGAAGAALDPEGPEEASTNKFRIKSPFLDQPSINAGERTHSRLDFNVSLANPALSPSQTLIRRSQLKYVGSKGGQSERSYPRHSHFRRTASFHETKQVRPFRERSMSTLTPRQIPAYSARTRTWDQGEDRFRARARGAYPCPEKLEHSQGTGIVTEPLSPLSKSHPMGLPARKPDLINDRPAGLVNGTDRVEPHRHRRGPSPSHKSVSRKQPSPTTPKDNYQRVSPLSPSQYRRDKCQSFPAHPEYAFYDNTSFGLTELEQKMLDLPGYFGSNEEDETTSTLSIEKLVI
ncbi:thrombospondin type-1 domain-containing protein 1 isoform X1 [Gracilinanus agilis]|uniref:thrombospondin type-1 domain-containing protein 1 isoform X1 n=1 Tax=Gracilinanus agilis TaxID=191870 RepID=UPI001CFC6F40|nr:thrombospondin type-1 domain-containing protein 1 isoform X1 [Gracilinanus agilis]